MRTAAFVRSLTRFFNFLSGRYFRFLKYMSIFMMESGLFAGQGVFKMSWVGSGRVRKCSEFHGSGRVKKFSNLTGRVRS